MCRIISKNVLFQDFIISESEYSVANGILSFKRGHPFLELVMTEQAKFFNPKNWGNLGPKRTTVCIKAYCEFSGEIHIEGAQMRSKFLSQYITWLQKQGVQIPLLAGPKQVGVDQFWNSSYKPHQTTYKSLFLGSVEPNIMNYLSNI